MLMPLRELGRCPGLRRALQDGNELGKTRVCAARDTGSSVVNLKAGTVFQESLTEIAILHWNRKSSTCLHEGLWSHSMLLG